MQRICLISLLTVLLIGCQWSPERDNPYDPYSIGFLGNSPPEIDAFYVTTHFFENDNGSISKYRLICLVSDEDNNFPASPKFPIFRADTIFQGYLTSDPIQQVFTYEGFADDLPDDGEHKFTVYVTDEFGLDTATADTRITDWNTGIRTSLVTPTEPENDPHRYYGPEPPRIVWRKPSGGNNAYLALTIRQQFHLRWDTIGISVDDTIAYIPTDKIENAYNVPNAIYAVYLTLYDNQGNSSTGVPGYFKYIDSESQTDESYRKEDYDD